MHKVAILDDQEQLHPHVKTYCIFTASILISVCTHAAAILDGQLEQLCPHAQIYCIFTASILISVCAHAVAILEGQHPCTNILYLYSHLLQPTHRVAVLDDQLEQLHTVTVHPMCKYSIPEVTCIANLLLVSPALCLIC